MPKAINKSGLQFGRLTVLRRIGVVSNRRWLCSCSCGNTTIIRSTSLGKTLSCGCLHREIVVQRQLKHGESSTRGKKCTIEYKAWSHAKQRCYNTNDKRFADYGGRGIKMCDKWRDSYEAFLADMGRRPIGRYSLDRIDVHGNYEPGNCRWATDVEQARNKRRKIYCKRGHLRAIYTDKWRGCSVCSKLLHHLRYIKRIKYAGI